MDFTSFKQIVDTYGTNLNRWPHQYLLESEQILEQDPRTKQYLIVASQFEEWLETQLIEQPDSRLAFSIFEAFNHTSQQTSLSFALIAKWLFLGIAGSLLIFIFAWLSQFPFAATVMFIQFDKMAFLLNY